MKIDLTYRAYGREAACTLEVRENTTDALIAGEVWDGQYFKEDFIVNRGDLVVDVGGCFGAFAILADKLGAGHVYTYEPIQASYALLIRNLEANGAASVVP
jgi:predicted RNA methylase